VLSSRPGGFCGEGGSPATSLKHSDGLNSQNRETMMTLERALRLIAGSFILLSVALAVWVNPKWLYFTAFVGLNLLQSAFTNWCPMMTILRKAGLRGVG